MLHAVDFFYSSMYSDSNPDPAVISELFQPLKENVNLTFLENEITYEELLTCLSLMGKNKATGLSMIG